MAADGSHRPANWAPRIEDAALLRGEGRFMDDVRAENAAAGCFVRSPHACARITSIDTSAARVLPGVLAVVTAEDMRAAGARTITHPVPLIGRGGSQLIKPFRPALAEDRVMFVGQPVVLVVAETFEIAQDAAELVAIDYEPLPAVVDIGQAIAPGAPQLWPEAPGNVAIDFVAPVAQYDAQLQQVERQFASAAHVAEVVEINQRIVVASLETRGATASYDAAKDAYLLRVPSQGARMLRDQLAASLVIPPQKLRLLTGDVGGAFGMKTAAYPEYVAMLVAARQVGRPVHWMSTRAESFLSDNQARDTVTTARLALDAEGRFLALKVSAIAAVGAMLFWIVCRLMIDSGCTTLSLLSVGAIVSADARGSVTSNSWRRTILSGSFLTAVVADLSVVLLKSSARKGRDTRAAHSAANWQKERRCWLVGFTPRKVPSPRDNPKALVLRPC